MLERRKLKLKSEFETLHHIKVLSAEAIGAFNTGFDTVNLHRPTMHQRTESFMSASRILRLPLGVRARGVEAAAHEVRADVGGAEAHDVLAQNHRFVAARVGVESNT